MKITTANGSIRQAWTIVIASSARFGRPSHCGGACAPSSMCTAPSSQTSALSRWSSASVQLTTLNSESKIQSQAIVDSATGAAHGSTTRKRTIHLPRKSRTRKCDEDGRADDDDRLRGEREDRACSGARGGSSCRARRS